MSEVDTAVVDYEARGECKLQQQKLPLFHQMIENTFNTLFCRVTYIHTYILLLLMLHPAILNRAILGLIPGAVGGLCSVCVGHPMDLIKVRVQASTIAQKPGTLLRTILTTEGIAGCYVGVTAPLLAVTPAFALTFASYEITKQALLTESAAQLTLGQTSIAGGVSGIFLAAVLGPLERIKCLVQVYPTRYTGFNDCLRQVYNEGGVRSIARGTFLTVGRDVPGNAAYFVTYETIRRTLLQEPKDSFTTGIVTLLGGGMAGVANWIVAIPFDTVKSKWQVAPTGKYNNPGAIVKEIIRTQGIGGLFRGLAPALMRAFPANAACLLGVETTRSLLPTIL